MSKYLQIHWLVILIVFFIVSAYFINESNFFMNKNHSKNFSNLKDREIVKIMVGNKKLNVEIVNSPETTKQGLSDRDEIGSDGMLFIFPESSMRNFWMYNMKFNLDFVWINGSEVVGITKNVKKPASLAINNQENPEVVSVNKYIDKVLELNTGDIKKYDIKVGYKVVLQ